MSSQDTLGTRLVRIAMLLSTLIYGFGFWVNRGRAFTDFRVLHLGAELIKDGRMQDAYDTEAFVAETAAHPELAETARELDVFLSTPVFALAMRPFAMLSANVALATWMIVGIVGVFAATRLLRLPLWAGLIVLVLPFGISNIYFAQTGFLALLWAAAIHRLCVDDKVIPAGVVAGLAVLKPTLLLGVAIWWLLDWKRWYPALLSALAVGTAIIVPTVIGGFEPWRLFLGALEERDALDSEVWANQPALVESVGRAVGTDIATHPLMLLAYLALGAVVLSFALRKWPERTAVLSGAAMIISVLISPHLLIYDAPLLLIPFAVAVHENVSVRLLEQMVAVFVVTSLMMIMSFAPFSSINEFVAPGTIGIVLAGIVWARSIREGQSGKRSNTDSTPPTGNTEVPLAA